MKIKYAISKIWKFSEAKLITKTKSVIEQQDFSSPAYGIVRSDWFRQFSK